MRMRYLAAVLLIPVLLAHAAQKSPIVPTQDIRVRLHEHLGELLQSYTATGATTQAVRAKALKEVASRHRLNVKSNRVVVVCLLADTSSRSVARILRTYGLVRDTYFGRLDDRLQVRVRLDRLEALARDTAIRWVQPPMRAHAHVMSEGVGLTYADSYQNHAPVWTGTGVKVAIIDLGFQGYTTKLGTELPATVTTKSFGTADITGGGQVHGTACAEVVHDMAPDAQLYLINFNSEVDLANAVTYCIQQGVKIISHSVGWWNLSFYDGTGALATIVNTATTNGILWVNAAANAQQCHWDGIFTDPDVNTWHNFSGGDETITVNGSSTSNAIDIGLTWNEWPAASTDFDLYLYWDSSGVLKQVASSTNLQNGSQIPDEGVYYTIPAGKTGTYHLKIKRKGGTATPMMALFSYPYSFTKYNVTARSMMDPGPVANSFTVGATYWGTDLLESFSSLGPTEDGRMKPDIAAPDGNTNSVYGNFYGTSSATPHTAGAAALLLSQDMSRTVPQLRTLLTANALDLGTPGVDNSYGAGRLRMPDVVAPAAVNASSSTHTLGVWSKNANVTMTWPVPTDQWTGVNGYSMLWDHNPITAVDSVIDQASTTAITPMAEGVWYFHIRAIDKAGNAGAASHYGPIKIDTSQPQIPTLVTNAPVPGKWTNAATLAASWRDTDFVSGVQGYVAAIDHSATLVITSGVLSATPSLNTAVGEGTWYVHIAGTDSAGNWSPTLNVGPYKFDRTPPPQPALTATRPQPFTWTNNREGLFTLSYQDALSGIALLRWAFDTLAAPAAYTDSGTASTVTTRFADGRLWRGHFIAIDSAGNTSPRLDAGTFWIDSTPPLAPQVTGISPSPSTWSRTTIITAGFTAASTIAPPLAVAVDWDTLATGNPTMLFFASPATSVALADGKKWMMHLRTLDSAGNWSPSIHLGPFFLDAHAPGSPIIVASTLSDATWNNWAVDTMMWRLAAPDTARLSNLAGYSRLWDHSSLTNPDTISEGMSARADTMLDDGSWYFHVRSVDSARNWSAAAHYGPMRIDRTAPIALMVIDDGSPTATMPTVQLTIAATDAGSGVAQMRFSNNGTLWSPWESFSASRPAWDLRLYGGSDTPGMKRIRGEVRDSAGNRSPVFTDSITYAPTFVDEAMAPSHIAISVYPRPAQSRVSITSSMAFVQRVVIMDALGRTVIDQAIDHGDAPINLDVRALPAGIYACRLTGGAARAAGFITVIH
jgi:subtilisin family serine protease